MLELPKLNDDGLIPNVLAAMLEAVNEKPDVCWNARH